MAEQTPTYALYLSREEMVVLLEEMGGAPSPNARAEWLLTEDAATQAAVLAAVRRSLVARQLLDPQAEAGERVDPLAAGVVAASAAPEASLAVIGTRAGAPLATTTILRIGSLFIIRFVGDSGVDAFVLAESPEELDELVAPALALSDEPPLNGRMTITAPAAPFNEFLERLAEGDQPAALALLPALDLPSGPQAALQRLAAGSPSIATLVPLQNGETAAATLLAGAGGQWITRQTGEEEVTLDAVPAAAVLAEIKAMLA